MWYEMDETTRQACVSRIANICKSMTTWTDESISGVDGNQLTEQYLIKPRAEMDLTLVIFLRVVMKWEWIARPLFLSL